MAIALAIMAVIVFMNVILRYFFKSGIPWTVELTQLLFVLIVFLGAIMALKDKMHINVDILTNAVSDKWKKILIVISNIIVLGILYVMFQGSISLVNDNLGMTTPLLGIPQSYIYGLGLVVSISMAFLTIKQTYELFKKKG